ncbi:AbrB/MazE/SpoVT family DNA-binding domain-containing protein [Marinospirillum sp.]|uniref:AbrB/MazE/SpoVT family DNA-binding domain-containing protein n=1 Tax=Marinospirillum sp. TaxID=2183934 RepID=UPI0028702534|nr:AbrB/MazE/SpoVT family DNA-binding domain-containing protein [Marinospirillum sp.]MDR9467701.1 AbrB/MazE/SpoVT family DNA-binding domain-containing protein [Marinospirillum sp.]
MRTHLRKIGNSRGVLLPSALLAESGITDEIEIRMEEGKLIIEPVQKPREGWFDDYRAEEDLEAFEDIALDEDTEEWEW